MLQFHVLDLNFARTVTQYIPSTNMFVVPQNVTQPLLGMLASLEKCNTSLCHEMDKNTVTFRKVWWFLIICCFYTVVTKIKFPPKTGLKLLLSFTWCNSFLWCCMKTTPYTEFHNCIKGSYENKTSFLCPLYDYIHQQPRKPLAISIQTVT